MKYTVENNTVVDLPVVRFGLHKPEKILEVFVTRGYDNATKAFLGNAKNLDEALALIFSYWREYDISCYINGAYSLTYVDIDKSYGRTTKILVNLGSPELFGRIMIY